MAAFRYSGFTELGDLSEGEIEASDRASAEDALWRRGLTPLDLREVGAARETSFLRRIFSARASRSQVVALTRELATLVAAEVPIDRALRIIEEQAEVDVVKELGAALLARVLDGRALSDACAGNAEAFDAEFVNILKAGETAGNIGRALSELADLGERRLDTRARLRAALVYPVLLIVLAIASTGIVLAVLVPSIAPIFSESGRTMPSGLAFVIAIGQLWPWLAAGFCALPVTMLAIARKARSDAVLKQRIDALKLRLPILGPAIARHEAARFALALGSMLSSGVRMLPAMSASRGVVRNARIGARIEDVIEAVRSGESFSHALASVVELPSMVARMAAVGEEARKLDVMLLRVAGMFERRTTRGIEQAMALLTPLLTVLIAAIVGGLVLSIMDAVLGINDLAAR